MTSQADIEVAIEYVSDHFEYTTFTLEDLPLDLNNLPVERLMAEVNHIDQSITKELEALANKTGCTVEQLTS